MLPHAYPFRLVESLEPEGGAVLAWTANGSLARGPRELPVTVAVEMMAQAALVALPRGDSAGEPARGLLAGLDAVRLLAPVYPGDALRARAELVGRFGRLVKARVTLSRDAETVAEGELLLALE